MSQSRLRVGIASFAHGHAYSYAQALTSLPDVTLAGVWDDNESRGQEAAERFETSYMPNLEALLSDCDTLIVAAENVRHKELVLAAAQAGRHVLCEKPLATNAADARVMVQACAAANVLLGVAFPVRYSPAVRRLRLAVQSGSLGQTLMIRATNRGTYPGGWFAEKQLSGGGALIDHIVHVADLLRWIWQSEFRSVYAEADTRYYDILVDDCGLLLITLNNDIVVSLDPSWSRPNKSFPTWGDVTFEVTGTAGSASVDVFAQNVELFNNEQVRAQHVSWGDNLDLLMLSDWFEAVRKGGPAPITGEDGLRTVELVEAAYQSARSQRSVQVGNG